MNQLHVTRNTGRREEHREVLIPWYWLPFSGEETLGTHASAVYYRPRAISHRIKVRQQILQNTFFSGHHRSKPRWCNSVCPTSHATMAVQCENLLKCWDMLREMFKRCLRWLVFSEFPNWNGLIQIGIPSHLIRS